MTPERQPSLRLGDRIIELSFRKAARLHVEAMRIDPHDQKLADHRNAEGEDAGARAWIEFGMDWRDLTARRMGK